MDKLADVDWIAEAIVERLELKKALYRKIDAVRKPGSIVSSNTSTIPISLLVEGMPSQFRAEFCDYALFQPGAFHAPAGDRSRCRYQSGSYRVSRGI